MLPLTLSSIIANIAGVIKKKIVVASLNGAGILVKLKTYQMTRKRNLVIFVVYIAVGMMAQKNTYQITKKCLVKKNCIPVLLGFLSVVVVKVNLAISLISVHTPSF